VIRLLEDPTLIQQELYDREALLRLAGTLTAFLARLRSAAETLSVIERSESYGSLSKTFSWATTPLPFAIASQSPRPP
jgi:hypothetical protein